MGKKIEQQLDFWDEGFIKLSYLIREEREAIIQKLNQFLPKDLQIVYLPSPLGNIEEMLKKNRIKEMEAGFSLIGPQKDNFIFEYKKRPLANFGSRGEVREGVIFFKLAEWFFLKEKTGFAPVLLFDDIFSELDKRRRELVSQLFQQGQIILTTTSLSYINSLFIKNAKIITLTKKES